MMMLSYDEPWLEAGDSLICFGDSITAGGGYTGLLQEKLLDRNITVINAGRGGDKTPWALTRLEEDVIARKPQAVSIALGANDAAVGRGIYADEPQVPPLAYRSNLIWIVHLCRLAGIKKFSICPPFYRFEGARGEELGDIMQPYTLMAREAADAMQTRFVPADIAFADEWARHPGHSGLLLTRDGVHLTKKAEEIVCDTMLKAWGMSPE
jgi:isoamyl acetate esterase